MLVEQLSTAYKCHSSIGNSLNLKEMINEVLKAFVGESYAIFAQFDLQNGDEYEKIATFGKYKKFDSTLYTTYNKKMNLIECEDKKVIKMVLNNGCIYLVTKALNADCSFFYSMFESLIPKLNISVEACVNYEKLLESYEILNEQKKELLHANKVKDEFLANMSHELKTPLNSIFLISSIMTKNKDNKYDERTVKNMEIIKKSANDLLELINDILDISQIDAGKIKISAKAMNLNVMIGELYDSLEPITTNKGIEFTKNIIGENFEINSDLKRVKQIVKNLLSNAIKFTQEGSVNLELIENNDRYEIVVKDSGIGIEKDKLEHIFDRFKQEDGTTTRKFGGTGLGLTISKELASLLGGNISVDSQKSVGSTFVFYLPKENTKISIESKEELAEKKDEVKQSKVKKLVLNHSNSITQFKLAIKLKQQGFDVSSIMNFESIKNTIDSLQSNDMILVFDENSKEFDEIYDVIKKHKENLVLITSKINDCSYEAKYYIDEHHNDDELISQIMKFNSRS